MVSHFCLLWAVALLALFASEYLLLSVYKWFWKRGYRFHLDKKAGRLTIYCHKDSVSFWDKDQPSLFSLDSEICPRALAGSLLYTYLHLAFVTSPWRLKLRKLWLLDPFSNTVVSVISLTTASFHQLWAGSLLIRSLEPFVLCLVCDGGCTVISGMMMDPGSNHGDVAGAALIIILFLIDLIDKKCS